MLPVLKGGIGMDDELKEMLGEIFPMITKRLELGRDLASMAEACARIGDFEGAFHWLEEATDFLNETDTLVNVATHIRRESQR